MVGVGYAGWQGVGALVSAYVLGLFGKAANEQVNTLKVGSVVLRQEGEVGGEGLARLGRSYVTDVHIMGCGKHLARSLPKGLRLSELKELQEHLDLALRHSPDHVRNNLSSGRL